MKAWALAAAMLAIPTTLSAETYSQPTCLKKTSLTSGSATEWVTISPDLQALKIHARANMFTPDVSAPPEGTLGILVDETVVAKAGSASWTDRSTRVVTVSTPIVLDPGREYKVSARVQNASDVHPPQVELEIDIADGCLTSQAQKTRN